MRWIVLSFFVLGGCDVALWDEPEISEEQFQLVAARCGLNSKSHLEHDKTVKPTVAIVLTEGDWLQDIKTDCVRRETDKMGVRAPMVR